MGDSPDNTHKGKANLEVPEQQYEPLATEIPQEQGHENITAANMHVLVEDIDQTPPSINTDDTETPSVSRSSPWATWGKRTDDRTDGLNKTVMSVNTTGVYSVYGEFVNDPEEEEDWLEPYLVRARQEMEDPGSAAEWEDPYPNLEIENLEEELWRLRQEIPVVLQERALLEEWLQHEQAFALQNALDSSPPQPHTGRRPVAVSTKSPIAAKRAASRNRKRASSAADMQTAATTPGAPTSALPLSYKQKLDIAIRKNSREEKRFDAQKEENWEIENELKAVIEESDAARAMSQRRLLTMQRVFSERVVGRAHHTSVHLYLAGQKDFVVPLEYFLKFQGEEDKSVVGAHNKYVTLVESYANKMLELRGRVTRNRGDDQFRITKLDYEQMQVHTLQLERQLQGVLAEIMAWKRQVTKVGKAYNATVSDMSEQDKVKQSLLADIAHRNTLLHKIRTERSAVDGDVDKARARNQKLKWNLEKFNAPSVLEYIQEKADLHATEKQRVVLERRASLAEAEATGAKKWWQYIQGEATPLVAPARAPRMEFQQ